MALADKRETLITPAQWQNWLLLILYTILITVPNSMANKFNCFAWFLRMMQNSLRYNTLNTEINTTATQLLLHKHACITSTVTRMDVWSSCCFAHLAFTQRAAHISSHTQTRMLQRPHTHTHTRTNATRMNSATAQYRIASHQQHLASRSPNAQTETCLWQSFIDSNEMEAVKL